MRTTMMNIPELRIGGVTTKSCWMFVNKSLEATCCSKFFRRKKNKKKIKHISLIFKGKPLEMEERRKVEKNLTPIKKKNNPYLLMLEIVYQPCKTETSAFNRLFVLLKEKSIALKSFNIHEIKLLLTYT